MNKLSIILLFFCQAAYSQVPPSEKFNTKSNYNLTDTLRNFDIREKLVQLAMNNPQYEVSDRIANVALYQWHLAKGSWLAIINLAGNINEFTIDPKSAGTTTVTTSTGTTEIGNPNVYYPKYNFGLNLPLDIFTRVSNTVKVARENYLIAQANKNDHFRQIKADILTKYEDYLLAKQKLDLQEQVTQDAYTNYQLAERDYRQNTIKAEDLSRAFRNWVGEQVTKLDMMRALNVTKIDIERIIGVKLDDVLRMPN
jgi:outer membrane protein TolC